MVRETSKLKGHMALLVGVKVGIRSVLYKGLRALKKKLASAKVQPLVAQVGGLTSSSVCCSIGMSQGI